jgi:Fe-S-cluster containining protein
MLEAGLSPLPREPGRARVLGVMAGKTFRELCEATPDVERAEAHLCSFYNLQERRCGIWQFRPGECSLYFCGSDAKAPEREKWSERAFQLESNLAQMALAHVGFSGREIAEQVMQLNAPSDELEAMPMARMLEVYRETWNWAKTQSTGDIRSWQGFDKPMSGE